MIVLISTVPRSLFKGQTPFKRQISIESQTLKVLETLRVFPAFRTWCTCHGRRAGTDN